MKTLEIKNISKIYGSGENQVRAIDGVDLVIENGEFISIVGSSGSGKTTLLNIPESVNHLGEIFSENLKILCLWRYVFLQCFHPIVKKYLESYNPKTLAVIRFLAHFHLLGSRIQV